jgi:hypothetical protein
MSFQRRQIMLPVSAVQAAPHRSANVLILRICRPREREQLGSGCLVDA